jgi:hypothetical protein
MLASRETKCALLAVIALQYTNTRTGFWSIVEWFGTELLDN